MSLTEAQGAAEANLRRTWSIGVPRTFPYPCEVPSDSEPTKKLAPRIEIRVEARFFGVFYVDKSASTVAPEGKG